MALSNLTTADKQRLADLLERSAVVQSGSVATAI
jgi:hypothetical protein